MQRLSLAALLPAALLGCSKTTGSPLADASPPVVPVASAVVAADVDASPAQDASSPSGRAARDALALVAVGDKPGSKIVWLQVNGTRVWLSGTGVDAYSDDESPLEPGPDLLKGLPYSHDDLVIVVGSYPDLFAYREKNEYCAVIRHPAAFVRKDGAWKQGQPLSEMECPTAFVAWNAGALFVDSVIPGWATSGAGPVAPGESGAHFRYLGPDGSVRPVDLGLDRTFETWGASSDGTHLSFIGAFGLPPTSDPDAALSWARDVVVMRGTGKGTFQSATVLEMLGIGSLRTDVREVGTRALVLPPPVRDNGDMILGAPTTAGDEMAWKGRASRLYVVTGDKVEGRPFRTASEQDCSLADAAATGDALYAVVRCPDKPWFLERWNQAGQSERVSLPSLVMASEAGAAFRASQAAGEAGLAVWPCRPRKVLVRPPDDLWIETACGASGPTVPAVFRRGKPQEPVRLP